MTMIMMKNIPTKVHYSSNLVDLEKPKKANKNGKADPKTLSTTTERDNVNLRAAMIHVIGKPSFLI